MTEDPVWVERPWRGDPGWTVAEVQMGGFIARAVGIRKQNNWWWEIFHEQQKTRSLRKAQGGGNMTEQGAKNVALAVLGVAIYADNET